MTNDDLDTADKFLGVDKELLSRILVLLRDKYPLADEANYFLESQGYAGINITITNQRDALSHLVALLSDHSLSSDGQLAQLHNAEEHLRRAMTEPYERAIDMQFQEILKLRDSYIQHGIPFVHLPALAGAPSLDKIDNKLRHAQSLRDKGRALKARNKWDEEWENGIKCFLRCFECLKELERELSEWTSRAQASRGIGLTISSIWVNVGFGTVGILAGLLISLLFQ